MEVRAAASAGCRRGRSTPPQPVEVLIWGGAETLKGEQYIEIPEYGVGGVPDLFKGKPQEFTWKVEANRWYHTGKLSSGLTIELPQIVE